MGVSFLSGYATCLSLPNNVIVPDIEPLLPIFIVSPMLVSDVGSPTIQYFILFSGNKWINEGIPK